MELIHNQFAVLRARAEQKIGRRLTYEEITAVTGIAASTLSELANQKHRRFDSGVIAKLVAYFQGLGVNCTVSDFLIEGPDFPPLAAPLELQAA